MTELSIMQICLIALIFVWSGFVRSGIGFGGAALSLPLLLLVENDPLLFLPLISIQLMIFSIWIAWTGHRKAQRLTEEKGEHHSNIDWTYLKRSMRIIMIPKLIGVLGLLTLPHELVSAIIFSMISVFAISYILNKPFVSKSKWADGFFLTLGGYFSGTSLVGAPLLAAVYTSHVDRYQLRDTLFVLWFILVVIKMTSFVIAGVNLQLIHQLWLFPCAYVGHLFGMKFHNYIQSQSSDKFFRVIGIALLIVCLAGFVQQFS